MITTRSDIKDGMIYNRTLLVYFVIAVLLDVVFYGFFANDLLSVFLENVVVLFIAGCALFYTHSFAGGDCKLVIVLSLLYPGTSYLVYGTSKLTLILALGIAILLGYSYLIVLSLMKIITKKNKLSLSMIKSSIIAFFKAFLTSALYVSMLDVLLGSILAHVITINVWIVRAICLFCAWVVNSRTVFKKWYMLLLVTIINLLFAVMFHVLPVSTNIESYGIVIFLLGCQLVAKTNLYDKRKIEGLKSGMILSTYSSMMLQNSRVRGLPCVSTEDLRSRLSEEEVLAIRRWAKNRDVKELVIVKKIPFALFLGLGFIIYFVIWSILV